MAKPRKGVPSWYGQIGIDRKNFARLKKLRENLSRFMGIKLSWNDFIGRVLSRMEAAVKEEIGK